MRGMGKGGNGRAVSDNRVIFTRDLGGDFAREENAASLFRSYRLHILSFPSTPAFPPRAPSSFLPSIS